MEDHPNDYILRTVSEIMLLKMGDRYVIGQVVVEINEMTAQFTHYHEVLVEDPPVKHVFKSILENGEPPIFVNRSYG